MRCGTCKNCVDLERVKRSVLRVCNPPFSHADQDAIDLWNGEVERLPCLQQVLSQEERKETCFVYGIDEEDLP